MNPPSANDDPEQASENRFAEKTLFVERKKITLAMAGILGALTVANVLVCVLHFNGYLQSEAGHLCFKKLYFDAESNFPTFFNTLLFIVASALLAFIFLTDLKLKHQERTYAWLILSILFLLLGVDENISIHEFTGGIVTRLGITNGTGIFEHSWIVPYSLLALLLVAYFYRFILSLDRQTIYLFIIAAAIYGLAVFGLEMIGGWIISVYGENTPAYAIEASTEEFMEMAALILFNDALFRYIPKVARTVPLEFR